MSHALVLLSSLLVVRGSSWEGDCKPSVSASMVQLQSTSSKQQPPEPACAPLQNKGSFFTVKVCVGTPPQCFDTVADTGSDNVIITSCICNDISGTGCPAHGTCFRGTDKSTTFHVPDNPMAESITFGSGTVETAVATDIVDVAGIKANMSNSLLLIVNKAALRINSDFHGILGLGLPKSQETLWASGETVMGQTSEHLHEAHLSSSVSVGLWANWPCMLFPDLCGSNELNHQTYKSQNTHKSRAKESEPLFLKASHVQRFSLCFLDSGKPGALRLQIPPLESPIPQIGKFHWGLSFVGMSIGPRHQDAPSKMIFCGRDEQKPGTSSPCGIIPDSGTTLLTGPSQQVLALERELCRNWPRCRQLGKPSSLLFQNVLLNCSGWLSEGGLEEIPSIFFHVETGGGEVKGFELTSWAFVTQTFDEIRPEKSYCFSGFEKMDYFTEDNGPVWIFGSPLFYEYVVGFDQVSNQVSLYNSECQSCTDSAALMTVKGKRRPRVQNGPHHIRNIDVSLPL